MVPHKPNERRPILAYHVTWTCYGQWLHGDTRGYVDDRHRTPGEPYEHNDPQFYNADAKRMSEPPCWLSGVQRNRAEEAIAEACEFRRWRLRTFNVQPDHAHVVVEAPGTDGKGVRQILKDRATRALKRETPGRRHRWTEGGKVVAVHDGFHLKELLDYVSNRQPFPKVRRAGGA